MGYDFYVPVRPPLKQLDDQTRAAIDAALKAGKVQKCPPCKYTNEVGDIDAGSANFFKTQKGRKK